MTDFWRLVNALIVAAVVCVALVWGFKRKPKGAAEPKAVKAGAGRLDDLRQRKQKLTSALKDYADDIERLETESRQMVDACLTEQEAQVRRLVHEESQALLSTMQAAARETLDADVSAVKTGFAERLDRQDH